MVAGTSTETDMVVSRQCCFATAARHRWAVESSNAIAEGLPVTSAGSAAVETGCQGSAAWQRQVDRKTCRCSIPTLATRLPLLSPATAAGRALHAHAAAAASSARATRGRHELKAAPAATRGTAGAAAWGGGGAAGAAAAGWSPGCIGWARVHDALTCGSHRCRLCWAAAALAAHGV